MSDSHTYIGQRDDDGEPHGKGTLCHDGVKYVGEWKHGRMHGHGVMSYADGGRYEGEFREGKCHGKGVLVAANGFVYRGGWVTGRHEGWGVLTDPTGKSVYNGQWCKGLKHGRGKLVLNGGFEYEGEFVENEMHGTGVMITPGGERYEGEFIKGNWGTGVLHLASGGRIEGTWGDGDVTGHIIMPDGTRHPTRPFAELLAEDLREIDLSYKEAPPLKSLDLPPLIKEEDKLCAREDSWRVLPPPPPEKREPLGFLGVFSADEMRAIGRGFIPESMDDHWFIFFSYGWLRLYRSWSGILIYALKIEPLESEYRVVDSWVNRDPQQYQCSDFNYERALVLFLIEELLLGKEAVLPTRSE